MYDSLQLHGLEHARLPWHSLSPRVYSNSGPLSECLYLNHLTLCCPLLLLPSIFHSIRVFSFRHDWFISLQCKGFSRIFSNTTTQKYQVTIQFSHLVISDSLWPHGLQHTRRSCPSPTPGAYSNSFPLRQWCHPTISSSVIPFSSCLQSFPASGSLPMSQFLMLGGQSSGASASVLLMNIQDWFPLGLTGWISLQSKGLSRVFSNTTVQKHQFFGSQLSL